MALIAYGRAFPNWEQQQLPKLEGVSNLLVISSDQSFINKLTSKLDRSINWSVTISDGTLYIDIGDETFETVLQKRIGIR